MSANDKRNGLTFRQWLRKVDAILLAEAGISSSDLADSNLWDEWDAEGSPRDGARVAMEGDDLYSVGLEEGLFDL